MLSPQGGDTAAAKQSLRQRMRQLRGQIPPEKAREASLRAAKNLLKINELQGVATVGMYAALAEELSPLEITLPLRKQGVKLAYPRVIKGQKLLQFCLVDSLEDLVPGSFGIAEPPPTAEAVPVSKIDLFVVPGLAFDRQGRRLGSGKGYYDSTLAHSPAIRVGFAFQQQLVSQVPSTDLDLFMDILITEAGVVYTHARMTRAAPLVDM